LTVDGLSLEYPRATFTEPMPYGYLYVGRRIDPPSRVPFVRKSAKRDNVLNECKSLARELTAHADVVAATVYEAVVIPPVTSSPRFDVIVLIQTASPETIPAVEAADAYQRLDADFVMKARNVRRIGDTDHPSTGTFLFNHFTAADPERALRTWEDITGWFTQEAGADNSALLQPLGEAPYVFVNHVRLPCGPIRFLLRFAKPSFRRFVARRLNANQIGNAPVFCKPV
jgi:hypothetical protein